MTERIATLERRTPNAERRTPNAERRTPNAERHNYAQKFPVRIAHIIGKMRNGGVESVVMNYYRNIDRTKIQYDFIVDEDSSNSHIQAEMEALGGKIITVPPYQKQAHYQEALFALFTQEKYPLVYSHINTLSVFPLFAAKRAGVPLRVAHNHSTAGRGEFKRNVMKYILRPFAKIFPTHLCACSEYAGRWLFGDKAVDSGRVKVWPNAINVERFAYNPEVRARMRKSLNLDGKFVAGHAGRFMHQKNHMFLIDIFSALKKFKPEAVLLLVGDGPLQNMIREKVNALGLSDDVIFTGSVYDMENYYQAMDVFILPSLYEGLPVVGSEVQVSGLPMLCANTVTPETKFCDKFRFMSLNNSPSEWAEEALRLCGGYTRRDMRIAATEHGFNIKTHADELTRWYCALLGIA
ncbi:MAG: glycosyltransferase family 1 protein [Synergistaceae bacterium]|nr:glycosyltransferase family 1 protein [Synergistaceae bacterium]